MTEHANDGWFSDETATFGDRLAGAREAQGLSQEDLARRLGVRLKTIQAWEDDLSEPRANRLQMMADIRLPDGQRKRVRVLASSPGELSDPV